MATKVLSSSRSIKELSIPNKDGSVKLSKEDMEEVRKSREALEKAELERAPWKNNSTERETHFEPRRPSSV